MGFKKKPKQKKPKEESFPEGVGRWMREQPRAGYSCMLASQHGTWASQLPGGGPVALGRAGSSSGSSEG